MMPFAAAPTENSSLPLSGWECVGQHSAAWMLLSIAVAVDSVEQQHHSGQTCHKVYSW